MRNKLVFVLILTFWATISVYAQPWSGIIDSSRAIDWSVAGVPGGVPSATWTQCGSTIAPYGTSNAYASPATINNAIAACGANHYVQLGAGNFYLNAGITWNVGALNPISNVALRGMGADQTFLHFSADDFCGGYTA